MKILVINGPNLNMLGKREPAIYGAKSIDAIQNDLLEIFKFKNISIDFFQSNSEGDLVDRIQIAVEDVQGIIINAGAFTHTSIAIHDAPKILQIPKIEVHISNIYSREEFRKNSFISPVVNGIIAGFGTQVYQVAISSLKYL